MSYKVFKFGGSSVKDIDRIKNLKSILQDFQDEKIVVVISAMGKTTNALEEVYHQYLKNRDEGLNALDKVIAEHLIKVAALELDVAAIEKSLQAFIIDNLSLLEAEKNRDLIYDQIISLGELFSTHIIHAYLTKSGLEAKWMDVRNVILTDDCYRDGKVDMTISRNKILKKVKSYFQKTNYIITQGFLGKSANGFTTTLGREGSDYTAAIFAYALDVEQLTIWKDVPGILTADPRKFENPALLDRLSYREAIEMTYYGAKVIHPKTIQPIQNKNIKLQVRSFLDKNLEGTLIADPGALNYPPIVVIQEGIIMLQITSNDFSFVTAEHLSIIFEKMTQHKIKMSLMRNSAISFTVCINEVQEKSLADFIRALGAGFTVEVHKGLELITIRHFKKSLLEGLIKDKVVMFEETLKDTVQMVVKSVPALKERKN